MRIFKNLNSKSFSRLSSLLLVFIALSLSQSALAMPGGGGGGGCTVNNATNQGNVTAGDDCQSATYLGALNAPCNCNNPGGIDSYTWSSSNTAGTSPNPYQSILNCQTGGDQASPAVDVWFAVDITANELFVDVNGLTNPNIGVWTGACGNLTALGCASGNGSLSANFTNVTVGSTVYIQVSGGDVNDLGNFDITMYNDNSCDDCILSDDLTVNPAPVNGTYLAGTTVTFCYSVEDYSQENTNWIHGIVPVFGNGWDVSTLTTTPAASEDGGGAWAWYNNINTPDLGNVDGFFYNSTGGPTPTDNFGDNCGGAACSWTWCWSITAEDCPPGSEGDDLGINIYNYADGETGSWTDIACENDPPYIFSASLTCCPLPDTSSTPETCFGACDGTATADGDAGGTGTGPWDYTWEDSGGNTITSVNNVNGSHTITGLCAGTYTVTVRDGNNCVEIIDITVSAPPQIFPTATATNSLCFGTPCNGTLSGSATGGVPGYSYSWDGGLGAGQNQTGVCAGTYTLTVTDANGCTATATATVNAPPLLTASASSTDETCDGACDGTLSSSAGGGTPPYSYSWDGGVGNGQNQNGICDGTYTVTVTDANGCIATASTTIAPGLVITANFNPIANQCYANGANSFSFTDNSTNATSWSWNFGDGNTSTSQNPTHSYGAAGTYTVTLTVTNGPCTDTYQQNVTVYPDPTVTASSTNVLCNGACDGTLSATGSGGSGGFSYTWDGGPAPGNQNQTNVCPGTYTVTVSDVNNCQATDQTTITEPPLLTISANATDASCFGVCDGSVSSTASGGTPPYSYAWDGGLGAGQNQTNVCAGSYTVTVTDANGCTATANATVTEPPALTASASATDATCNGVCDGTLSSSGAGGTTPYTYSWDGGLGTSQNPTNVCAGTYTITITDANGCTATASATVTEPPLLTVSATGTNATCNGVCDGSVSSNASGGTAPYTYNWDNGAGSNATANGLCANTYTVTVTDANGCTATASYTVTEPAALTANAVGTNASCNGVCDGTATVTASGGTTPYTYLWDDPGFQTTAGATGLCAGTWTVTITDANGCTTTASYTVTEPAPMVLTITSTDASCGLPDGQACVAVTGGTFPYTYLWDDGSAQTTACANAIGAGGYTVTVTDANGCVQTATATINDGGAPTATITASTNVSCNGGNNGSATVTATGGTTPYTYAWSPFGGTAATASGLTAGTYTVTVTDAGGCIATASVTITEPPLLTGSVTSTTDPLCAGVCDGTAGVTVTGGVTPYTYAWASGGTTANETGLCAGNTNVTITDANGCAILLTATLVDPPVLTANVTGVDALCNGVCDGSANLTVTGGTTPYSYAWDNASTSEDLSGLCAGTYNVTVTDANGCTATASVTINEPAALVLTPSGSDATCGQANGQACVAVTGGTTPYTYLWDDGGAQTTACADNVAAGVYNVTVTDANGCVATASFTVNNQAGGTATAAVDNNASCAGVCDGQATVTMTGGTSPFTYLWSTGGTGATETGLCAGTHTVDVTDANGCVASATVTITEPTTVTASVAGTDVSCNGVCDGSADVTVNGGTTPYTFAWDHGPTAEDLTGVLCAGNYGVTITDANGCSVYQTVTITEPPLLNAGLTSFNNPTCAGICDGDATIGAVGGVPPYTYLWSTGGTGVTETGICDGAHTVTVTDANGCQVVTNLVLTEPPALVLTTSGTDANCGQADGQVCVAVSGGTTPYTYLWDDGSAQTTACANSVTAGSYTVTVTDANGCIETATITINDLGGGTATAAVDNNASCNGVCDGQATVTMTGGTTPYTYLWSSGGTGATETGLCAGTYTVDVTDANGCVASTSVTITEPAVLTASTTGNDVSCNGVCDGDATVTAGGGTTPYTYAWSSGGTAINETGLCAGTYTVTVTDANGCVATANVTISEPTAVTLTTSFVDANCGQSDGQACVTASGGVSPYTYLWDDGNAQTTVCANNVPAGSYTVTVTDATGCTATATVAVGDQAGPALTIVNQTDALCNGACDGTAQVSATGGTTPYTYSWSSGGTTDTETSLCAGTYTVNITDANGCTDNIVVTINEPTPVVATITGSVDVTGNGLCDGSATVAGSGGTSPYTYQWDANAANQTTATATGLCAGTYCVDVIDANGCVANVCVTILEPNAIIPVLSGTDATCFGVCDGTASVLVSGGVSPYTYLWSDGQTTTTATGLCAGSYTVDVTDANGITVTSSAYVVNEPPLLTATTSVVSNYNGQDVSCFGVCDGSADVTAAGGTSPYTYEWFQAGNSLGQFTQIATNLCAGTYDVEVTDANGCQTTVSVTLTEPAPLVNAVTVTDASCFGVCDGSVTSSVTGGTTPYTYQWDDPGLSTTPGITGQCAGTYTVVVTDANGCSVTQTATINEPSQLVLTTSSNGSNCGQADGDATVTVVSGDPPYTYQWDANAANQTTATATTLGAGCYDVTVTDGNGCSQTVNVCVIDLGAPTVSILTQTDATCFGSCDGFAQIQVTGGTSPYNYTWYDDQNNPIGQTTASAFNLCAGTYTGEMIDANGCQATVSVTIGEPTQLNAAITTFTDVTCFGDCDGQATVVASGGTTPYTYLWSDPATQSTPTATGLCPGTYSVIVTDGNGCDTTLQVTIGEPAQITLTTSTIDAFCNTGSGSATVNITNGVSPFTYLWTPGNQSSQTAIGLTPGTYDILVTDMNGCTATAQAVVGNIPEGVATISGTTDVSCNGLCDGTMTVSMSGTGTPPYAYQWYTAGNVPVATDSITGTNLCAGDYYVVVTDANGCQSTSNTATINEPPALAITTTVLDASCKDDCTGEATAIITGGTSPFTYQWDDGLNQITPTAINLCAGTYNVVVTDANGCIINGQAIVEEPPLLVLDSTVVNANCGLSDGQACVIASGGTAPYTYAWPGGQTNSCEVGLPAGTYCVTVTDANLCSEIICIEIGDNSGPTAAIVGSVDVSCNGGNDGSATVDMIGGNGWFTVQWDANAGNQTTPTAVNLAAGVYSVNIQDSIGCTASASVTINEPTPITFIPNWVDPTCFGYCDGVAWIAAVGGTPPYSYDWRDDLNNPLNINNDTVSNLCAGDYTLILTDANGCTEIINYTLTDPAQVTGTASATDVSCFGVCDGTATATGNVGIAPFSYQWDANAGNQTTALATGLCPGTYSCTITDANGCFTTVTATVGEPPLLTAAINTFGHVSCNGACDGFAQVDVAGGTPPYLYNWTGGGISQVYSNLCAGIYDVTVTDANGCTATAQVTITEPTALSVITNTTDVDCYQACNGEASAIVSGGTPPYSYLWDAPGFPTTPTIDNLCAGTYNVTITDLNGCIITASVTITEPTLLDVNISVTDANCGQDNGEICVTAVGGNAPYTYQWNDPNTQTSSCADSLFSGCYTITLTDANGCTLDSLICINDILGPSITLNSVTDVSCAGASDGGLDFNITGGTLPYQSITWQINGTPIPGLDGLTTGTNLAGGCYTITVVDDAGCTFSLTECINEPQGLASAITASTDASCFLASDGTATAAANGGTMPYTYQWNGGNNPNDSANTGLSAGTYTVTVTDANGCTSTSNVTIDEPALLVITIDTVIDVSCFGGADGIIDVNVTGGTPPYLYTWTPNVGNGPTVTNLSAGSYIVDVTDAHGCTATLTITVNEPPLLTLSGTSVNSTCTQCNGTATVNPAGGTAPYTYLWGDGQTTQTATGLCLGTHTVTVTDNNGCTEVITIDVFDTPGAVIDSITFIAPACFGTQTGSATVFHSGGTAPYTYQWDANANNQVAQTAVALGAGTYCVTVTDANGCTVSQCVNVTEPNQLVPVPDLDRTICYGDSTQIWGNAQGGTPPYTINWTGGGFVGAGPHTVNPTVTTDYCFTVTDANGCISAQGCVTISVTPALSLDLTPDLSICDGESTTLTANASGGNGDPYNFEWHEGAINGNLVAANTVGSTSSITVSPNTTTWYYVILDDGCTIPVVDSVEVTVNPLPIGFVNIIDPNGCAPFTAQFSSNTDIGVTYDWDFDCDGVIDYSGTDDAPSWVYNNPGVYDVCVTITSADGCSITVTEAAFVEVYSVPVADFTFDPPTTTILNPVITFTDQSVGADTYHWDFGDGNTLTGQAGAIPDSASNGGLTTGWYENPSHTYADSGVYVVTLTITNQWGCSDQITYVVTIEGDYAIYVPNAFTPDGDGINDFFYAQGVGIDPENFTMYIFDRWGELIFEAHSPNVPWDGTYKGFPVEIEVYVWKIVTMDHRKQQHEYVGHVTVVR